LSYRGAHVSKPQASIHLRAPYRLIKILRALVYSLVKQARCPISPLRPLFTRLALLTYCALPLIERIDIFHPEQVSVGRKAGLTIAQPFL
jgi:hypothetical protein